MVKEEHSIEPEDKSEDSSQSQEATLDPSAYRTPSFLQAQAPAPVMAIDVNTIQDVLIEENESQEDSPLNSGKRRHHNQGERQSESVQDDSIKEGTVLSQSDKVSAVKIDFKFVQQTRNSQLVV